MGSKLNIATQGKRTRLSHSESPTWRRKDLELQNHFAPKHSCHWPCITSSNILLLWPDSIHSPGRKTPLPSRWVCQTGNSTSSRQGQASSSTSTKEREELCSCGERYSSLSCGRLADRLKHLVQFHCQEQALVVLVNRFKKITMQNWHIYHSFKMEFITRLQISFIFHL